MVLPEVVDGGDPRLENLLAIEREFGRDRTASFRQRPPHPRPRLPPLRRSDRPPSPTSKSLIPASLPAPSSSSLSLRSPRTPSTRPQAAPWHNCSALCLRPPQTRPMPSFPSRLISGAPSMQPPRPTKIAPIESKNRPSFQPAQHNPHAGGRRGRLHLPHRTVETPVFMPVGTQGSVKAVPQDTLESLGAEIILGNTYHLYLRPGHDAIRRMGGLHRFISWPRALLTDSGGFQVFSLSQLRKVSDEGVRFRSHLDGSSHFFTPEHSIDVQIALGADICMAFDECTEYPADRARAPKRACASPWPGRAARSITSVPTAHEVPLGRDQLDMWVPQVSRFGPGRRAPRRRALEAHAVPVWHRAGRHVPRPAPPVRRASRGDGLRRLRHRRPERRRAARLTLEMIAETLPLLPNDKPRYVMGVGYPDEIEQYARMGVDMMDCVLPTEPRAMDCSLPAKAA